MVMCQEGLINGYERTSSVEKIKWESVPKVARRNAIKTPLKPLLRISTYHKSPGITFHMIEQSGIAASERDQTTTKPRGSAKLNESTKGRKSQCQDVNIRVVIFRIDLLYLQNI